MTHNYFSRRHFFYGSLLAGAVPSAGFGSVASLKRAGFKSPNEKLNIAAVGAGGKGRSDIASCLTLGQNIVALCDPDEKRAAETFNKYPNLPRFKDYRLMLDREGHNIDAVLVSCPDFMHASVSLWAMERGKHVYCQKPLTRTVWEAQEMLKSAQRNGVATQMGNQGYSNEGARQACEIVWSGDIGNVTEVHAWTDRPGKYWPQGPQVEPTHPPVPSTLDWEAWQGGMPEQAYSPAYVPHNWRAFPEYGAGAIGDMACHILGTPNMALLLSRSGPVSVECIKSEGKGKYTFPHRNTIRFDFPARGAMPALKLFWYDSLSGPFTFDGVPKDQLLGDKDINGSLFVGDKGLMTTGCYGEDTRLMPNERMKDYKLPPRVLTRSPGHYADWIRACKGGEPSCSNFGVSAPFVSWMLLGVIAMKFEGKLEWDQQRMQFTNNKAANDLLRPKFRKGWKLA